MVAVVVSALIGVAIAGLPQDQPDLNLKPLSTSTTLTPSSSSAVTTTTAP